MFLQPASDINLAISFFRPILLTGPVGFRIALTKIIYSQVCFILMFIMDNIFQTLLQANLLVQMFEHLQ